MLDKFSDVFENKLGTFTSAKAKLTLKDDSQARFLTDAVYIKAEGGGGTAETPEWRYSH